jgi:hypothetical protein
MSATPDTNKVRKLSKRVLAHKMRDDKPDKMPVKKIVMIILVVAIVSSMISYTLVLSKESNLLSLHKQTSKIQMENIEIKTNVEFARSLYNVETKAMSVSYLHKPEKVIEVEADKANLTVNVDRYPDNKSERIVGGY